MMLLSPLRMIGIDERFNVVNASLQNIIALLGISVPVILTELIPVGG